MVFVAMILSRAAFFLGHLLGMPDIEFVFGHLVFFAHVVS